MHSLGSNVGELELPIKFYVMTYLYVSLWLKCSALKYLILESRVIKTNGWYSIFVLWHLSGITQITELIGYAQRIQKLVTIPRHSLTHSFMHTLTHSFIHPIISLINEASKFKWLYGPWQTSYEEARSKPHTACNTGVKTAVKTCVQAFRMR